MIISFPDKKKHKIKNDFKCAVFSLRIFSFSSSSLAFFRSAVGRRLAGILCIWKLVLFLPHFTSAKHSALVRHGTEELKYWRRWENGKSGFVSEFVGFNGHTVVCLFLPVMGAPSPRIRIDIWTLLRVTISRRFSITHSYFVRRMQRQERINLNCHTSFFFFILFRISNITRYGDSMAQFTDG